MCIRDSFITLQCSLAKELSPQLVRDCFNTNCQNKYYLEQLHNMGHYVITDLCLKQLFHFKFLRYMLVNIFKTFVLYNLNNISTYLISYLLGSDDTFKERRSLYFLEM